MMKLQQRPQAGAHPGTRLQPASRAPAQDAVPSQRPSVRVAAAAAAAPQAPPAPSQPPPKDVTVWVADAEAGAPSFPRLQANMAADVCIVGGGIAGLTAAYQLVKAGRSVVLLEAAQIGGGQTGKSTAQLMTWNDDGYGKLMNQFGRRRIRAVAKSHRDAIKTVRQICTEEKIECDFEEVDGYLFPHEASAEAFRMLDTELLAAKDAKVPGVERVNLGGKPEAGGIQVAVKFPGCANFNPVKYVQGLAKAVAARGGQIHENTRVKEAKDRVVSTESGARVSAENIVLASNSPLHHNLLVHSRQTAERVYVSALQLPEGAFQEGQYWDTRTADHHSYHIVRRVKGTPQGDVLLVRGMQHPCGEGPDSTPARPWVDLESWARQRWTSLGKVVYRWSGQVMEPIDGLHLAGRDPPNFFDLQTQGSVFTATGDSGQGTTGATTAGTVIAAAILGQRDPYQEIFSPTRLPSPLEDTGSNLAGVLTHVSKGYLGAILPNGTSAADMPRGSGAVITEGSRKVAAYKDESGVVQRRSAICPHMLCAVEWNPAGETFECSCHGSYWDSKFKLLQGPAKSDLPPLP